MKPALLVFARAPVPGRAKTRLARQIGPAGAAWAYESLLVQLVDHMRAAAKGVDLVLYAASTGDRGWLDRRWPGAEVRLQRGRHLGERLSSAFAEQFRQGRPRAFAVGADIPHLHAGLVQAADRLLDRVPVVVGPAEDGGYYLIGQRANGFDLFEAIDWGTSRVYSQTLRRALALGLPVGRLPRLYDVDTLADWLRYRRESRPRGEREPAAFG